MSIDFKWFEDFLSLARNNNFSRASEERHVTQSAFSRRIKALELWLGTPLIDRSTYPTQLTDAGKVFSQKAQEVVILMNDIKNECHEMKVKDEKMVQFTLLHTTAVTFFPKWIIDIENDTGPMNVRVETDNLHNCVQNLTEAGSDFLISLSHPSISLILDPETYPSLAIGKDRLIPVSVPAEDNQPKYTLSDQSNTPVPYLAYPQNSYFGNMVNSLFEHQSLPCQLEELYVNSFADAIRSMALEGKGLAWLPESMISDDLALGRFVKIPGEGWAIDLDIRIYRHISPRRAPVEALWRFLLQKYSQTE